MNIITADQQNSDPIFALVYGGSGTGKTHLMGTLGELGTVLIIDIDQGTKTITRAKDLQKYHDNITICDFTKFKDLDTAAQLVDANDPDKWNKEFGTKDLIKKPFDWIVWDTWSEIQWFMMQELRKKNNLQGSGLNFRQNVQIQHWGMMTDLNKLAIQQLRLCRVNQVFTMQEAAQKDELTGAITGGPAIHGKLVQELPGYFDVVVRTGTDLSGAFTATTLRKGLWPAKTRLGEGALYKNPTAKQIFI